MNRLMKYNEAKGFRFTLSEAGQEEVIGLNDGYIYAKLEQLECIIHNNIAVYVNDATEEDYILFTDELVIEDIDIKKIKVKLLSKLADIYNVQVTLKR